MALIPYPEPLDSAVSERMRRNRRRDSRPERALRSMLHARGTRFRVDYPIRLESLRVRPDVAFTRWRIAVFVDGCFWHSCPLHGNVPAHNIAYWAPKLQRNVARDRRVDAALAKAGWRVIRAWEHEPTCEVVGRVLDEIRGARSQITHAGMGPATGRRPNLTTGLVSKVSEADSSVRAVISFQAAFMKSR